MELKLSHPNLICPNLDPQIQSVPTWDLGCQLDSHTRLLAPETHFYYTRMRTTHSPQQISLTLVIWVPAITPNALHPFIGDLDLGI